MYIFVCSIEELSMLYIYQLKTIYLLCICDIQYIDLITC